MPQEPSSTSNPGIAEERHVCVQALLRLAGRLPRYGSGNSLWPRIQARLLDALNTAISGNSPQGSGCPLCDIAHEIIRINDESNRLFLCENLGIYVLRRILTSMLNILQSADQNASEEKLQDVYDRLLLIKHNIRVDDNQRIPNTRQSAATIVTTSTSGVISPSANAPHQTKMFDNAQDANVGFYLELYAFLLLSVISLLFCILYSRLL
ncbi:hypothetical protein AX14_013001 [Amanita brunnescens Koide BX004]|nr:hypothetical protein AX14_013001 [Amanita brunnescens Koide BX004]